MTIPNRGTQGKIPWSDAMPRQNEVEIENFFSKTRTHPQIRWKYPSFSRYNFSTDDYNDPFGL